MSEQIRIEFYIEKNKYGHLSVCKLTFWDIQRGKDVEEEFLVGRIIEQISCEDNEGVVLTLKEKRTRDESTMPTL